MRWIALCSLVFGIVVACPRMAEALDPEATVLTAVEILREQTQIPAKGIPESLLADAQGVAIIPDVIKIGFVAAIRRGRGVVMIRDANGNWTLPQFITLTGGSLGWQAGIQGTDVVLVFTTRKSVDGLLRGKFTIGADASASAGPVGRNASAATDARLRSEILSYSRSRGLFAGVALDGSAIEMDPVAQEMYYGAPQGQQPARIPESAMRLVQTITALAGATRLVAPGTQPLSNTVPIQPGTPLPTEPVPMPGVPAPVVGSARQQLAMSAGKLNSIVSEQWQKFLALPPEVFSGQNPPSLASMQEALGRYDRIVQSPNYAALVARPEFRSTYALLRDYVHELSPPLGSTLSLPPPPSGP
jgi:lipid-binding SYLF domain-containing protein